MSFILFKVLALGWFLLCLIIATLHFYLHIQAAQVTVFQQLDHHDWTLISTRSTAIARVSIKAIVNHQLYIVVLFKSSQHRRMVIWFDQLSVQQWKKLRVLAKLF
ncbi:MULTISPECIES: hypothetical protein [unclassified Acinetobacter]|uniref:hypothetical protein n=1 Tax=unclassified Acinetobacter TaxID=196816 RepID=UPI0029341F44|nr:MULTISPECIES: hypothetical protein [unclassified Acinetobacter]WOE31182.1 hypothetical protein QSG84_12685 [Acinetobacter sp. SAAs470]WOE39378.1 hypothetical protein QSG86_06350 [Acinetobacter sp. SAAs474]